MDSKASRRAAGVAHSRKMTAIRAIYDRYIFPHVHYRW